MDYDHDNDHPVEVTCPVCGTDFEFSAKEANGEAAPCCCEECERQWPAQREQEIRDRMAELNYRGGYEYACGYHD